MGHPSSVELAEIVRNAVADQGLSIRDLASATLIPRTTLDRRLAGASPFTVPELRAIAACLGTSGSALLAAAEAVAA